MGVFAVTGGTGFLGEHIVRRLVQDGHQVRVISRYAREEAFWSSIKDADFDLAIDSKVSAIAASVMDTAALTDALAGCDGVFHLAGVVEHSRREPSTINDVNIRGTLNCIDAASEAGVRRVVYASTSGVCAVSKKSDMSPAKDTSPYADTVASDWPYYASKIQAERAGAALAADRGVELVSMRPTLLLGPGDRRLSSCRLVADLLRGRVPLCPSGGLSFVDVRDAADAFFSAMAVDEPRGSYLLGAVNMTLREFLALVGEVAGVSTPQLGLPPLLERLSAQALYQTKGRILGTWDKSLDPVYVEMGQAFWYLDSAWAREDLSFSPRAHEETVKDTVEWLRGNWDAIEET